MHPDEMLKIIGSCEQRLQQSLQTTQAALDQLNLLRAALQDRGTSGAISPSLADGRRDEIVQAVLAAMGSHEPETAQDLVLLSRQAADGVYRIGRRRLNLTETESQIMDIFWAAKPDPVSRQDLHARLYPGAEKPNIGVIDVFISKLRQKLKLASNGREHLESVRGRGWGLSAQLCRADDPA